VSTNSIHELKEKPNPASIKTRKDREVSLDTLDAMATAELKEAHRSWWRRFFGFR